ncbi:MAG: carboxypeptidase regulatory-like domain-containing protein, partial [Muribaculaceae bacterium]|nr:carboxypeptidase regulatory-like domain-containing protein [Muribaculaceae bacterium]
MKKLILLAAAALVAGFSLQAKTADEFRIYLNPGHGSYGANDRPMRTIGHPNTGVLNAEGTTWIDTDTLGFYEGRGTLPRAFAIGNYLKSVGVKSENIVYSRLANGPWPYTTPNSEYDPDEIFNRPLAEICEEVEEGNFDMFISSHSNAANNGDGSTTNYPLFLYRGYDTGNTGDAGYNGAAVAGSDDMARTIWPYHHMGEIEPQSHYSATNMNVRGDISFYGSYSTSTRNNGQQYAGYLGVLKHGVPGYLLEGFFHTYQPSRHRALNFDYDRLEGLREARGVATYWGFNLNGKGEIAGTVKDLHEKIVNNLYNYAYGSDDQWLPLNGAKVVLKKDGVEVASYDVDNEWNGFFAFFDLEPGNYTLEATCENYKPLVEPIAATVTANNTCYSFI